MVYNSQLKELALSLGADYFGVADLAPAHEAILAQGGEVVAGYPFAVSVGIDLMDAIVEQLPRRNERAVATQYRSQCYDIINYRLNLLVSYIASAIQKQGYKALPISASEGTGDERICAVFSHKMAAHLAGLGWIGKSCLLVTPEHGPRVRWASILTDAPLTQTGTMMEERCGDCRECVAVCPTQAFTGKPFRTDEPREVRYDAGKCNRYLGRMRESNLATAVCGLCLYVCPYGRQELKKRENAIYSSQ